MHVARRGLNGVRYNAGVTHDPGLARGLRPGPPLEGALRTPGSKSLAQRALVCALLARGRTTLAGLPAGSDVRAALELAAACGAQVLETAEQSVRIEGTAGSGGPDPKGRVDVGESATLGRSSLAALACNARPGTRVELVAQGSLQRRSSPALIAALERGGVEFASRTWPWVCTAAAPRSEYTLETPSSSQELSALLIALAAHPGRRSVRVRGNLPSRPYVEMTCAVLAAFGAAGSGADDAGGSLWHVEGPLRAPRERWTLEPDASSAAVALAAGCLSGGSVLALGLEEDSLQGDVRIAQHLEAFGCKVEWCPDGLRAGAWPRRAAELDLSGEPDLAPVLAVVAAAAALDGGTTERWSRLGGLGTLPGKESARSEVLAAGLTQAGWRCELLDQALRIGPRSSHDDAPVLLDAQGDHRMAFAFALLGLLRPGVQVAGAQSVAKSWPGFWDDMHALGARCEA
jgi:3-phosphoshikimate 1-carboxyvinyltransferase